MTSNFEDIMSKRTDAEIIKILTEDVSDYQPAAIEAAKKEFEKRKLSADVVETVKKSLEQENEVKKVKASEPLSFVWKFLTFIFPGAIQMFLYGKLKTDGYDTKASELKKWTLFGFLFYLAIIVLIFLTNK